MTIEAERLRKIFDAKKTTLQRCGLPDCPDFRVEGGEVCFVVGKNGCGKTTLLRMLSGSITPDSGLARCSKPKLSITDFDRFFHHRLTARESVRYVCSLFGAGTHAMRHIDEALSSAGIAEKRSSRIGTLSKGQKVKVALSVMNLFPWKSILLDEPSNGLDPEGQELLCTTLENAKGYGAAVLVASHDESLITKTGDRVVSLSSGISAGKTELKSLRMSKLFEIRTVGSTIAESGIFCREHELKDVLSDIGLQEIESVKRVGCDIEKGRNNDFY